MTKEEAIKYIDDCSKIESPCRFMVVALSSEDLDGKVPEGKIPEGRTEDILETLITDMDEDYEYNLFRDSLVKALEEHGLS